MNEKIPETIIIHLDGEVYELGRKTIPQQLCEFFLTFLTVFTIVGGALIFTYFN